MRYVPALALWLWAGAAYAVVGNVSITVCPNPVTMSIGADGTITTPPDCQRVTDASGNVTCNF